MLLRLHSHLSGKPDSYEPPIRTQNTDSSLIGDVNSTNKFGTFTNDQHQEETQTPQCGDGVYYISRLLDKLTKGSILCYKCVSRTRLKLWPKAIVMNNTITQEEEDCKKRKRKLALMEEIAQCQRAFLESTHNLENLNTLDMQLKSTSYIANVQFDKLAAIPSSSNVTTSALNNCLIDMDDNSKTNVNNSKSDISTHPNQPKYNLSVNCPICRKSMVKDIKHTYQRTVGLVIFVQVCFSVHIFKIILKLNLF